MGLMMRCSTALAVFFIFVLNPLPVTGSEPIDPIWKAWTNRQNRLQTIRFEWIEKTIKLHSWEFEDTKNCALFGKNSSFKLTLDSHYLSQEDEQAKITILSSPEFKLTCWESSQKTDEVTIMPGGSGCWNLETSYRFLQPLFRPTDECTPQDFTVSKSLSIIEGQPCISVSRTQKFVKRLSIVTTLYVAPAFGYLPLRRVVEMRDDYQEPYRKVDTHYKFRIIDDEFVPCSWKSTTTYRELEDHEETIASVLTIEMNNAFDEGTFQVALLPGTKLTDLRRRGDMQTTTLRTQQLMKAAEDFDE